MSRQGRPQEAWTVRLPVARQAAQRSAWTQELSREAAGRPAGDQPPAESASAQTHPEALLGSGLVFQAGRSDPVQVCEQAPFPSIPYRSYRLRVLVPRGTLPRVITKIHTPVKPFHLPSVPRGTFFSDLADDTLFESHDERATPPPPSLSGHWPRRHRRTRRLLRSRLDLGRRQLHHGESASFISSWLG